MLRFWENRVFGVVILVVGVVWTALCVLGIASGAPVWTYVTPAVLAVLSFAWSIYILRRMAQIDEEEAKLASTVTPEEIASEGADTRP